MRLVSWNVNGLRAAIRKGIDGYFDSIDADIWMLQETRVLEEQFPKGWSWPDGYSVHLHPAEKKGYSGVATLSRGEMTQVATGMESKLDPNDSEGRIIVSKHGELTCINTYLPSGSNKEERQLFKESWMAEWRQWLQPFLALKTPVIVCGDLNIAHTEDDIWNAKGNKKSSGFLPQERQWFSDLLSDGWSDVFREHVGEGHKQYSWWSNRGQARVKDRGWRIDYFLANPAASSLVKDISIIRQGGIDISDHAPVVLDIDL
jgi:exodeoxyribonuclease-3